MTESLAAAEALPKRVVARIVSVEFLTGMAELADCLGLDMVSSITFMAIWTSNTEHLMDPGRYATIFDLPPNIERRPITREDLAVRARLPLALANATVDALIAGDLVEEGARGLVVPSAVFTQPRMLDSIDLTCDHMQKLITVLATYGFPPPA